MNTQILITHIEDKRTFKIDFTMPVWVTKDATGVCHVKAPFTSCFFFVKNDSLIDSMLEKVLYSLILVHYPDKTEDADVIKTALINLLLDLGWYSAEYYDNATLIFKPNLPNTPLTAQLLETGVMKSCSATFYY